MNRLSHEQPEQPETPTAEKTHRHNPNFVRVKEILVGRNGEGSSGEPAVLRVFSDMVTRKGEAEPAWYVTLVQGGGRGGPSDRDPVYLGDIDGVRLSDEIMKLQAELQDLTVAYRQKEREKAAAAAAAAERAEREKERRKSGLLPFRII